METLDNISAPKLTDHDVLIALYRDVQHLTASLKDLKEGDIKEIKDGTNARLTHLESKMSELEIAQTALSTRMNAGAAGILLLVGMLEAALKFFK